MGWGWGRATFDDKEADVTPRFFRFVLAGTLPVFLTGVLSAGGWVVITTQDLPERVVAGRPLTLTYAVRQHGIRPLDGLIGQIEARAGDHVVRVKAVRAAKTGFYSGTLTLPAAGNWTIAIDSGFGGNADSLAFPVSAIAAGSSPAAPSGVQRGHQLFAAKGCIICHAHPAFETRGVGAGPALGTKAYRPDYVKRVLSRSQPAKPGEWKMPDLGLRDTEIAPLVAFITSKRVDNRFADSSYGR
jgi:hypothetical protein